MFKLKATYLTVAVLLTVNMACKDQLDVINPNSPTPSQIENESQIYPLALGAVYVNGFQGVAWLGDSYFSLCWGYHELLGDMIGAEASNNLINQINLPDYVIYDVGGSSAVANQKVSLPAKGRDILRANNSTSKADNNPLFYEWRQMYALNNSSNYLIDVANRITFVNGTDDKNTVLAWAYFWKGWAYSHIGSIYYAGIINDQVNVGTTNGQSGTNGNFVDHTAILAEANKNYDKAIALLNTVSSTSALANIITTDNQIDLGKVPTPAEWIRNINSLKARNLLFDRLAPLTGTPISGSTLVVATPTDWQAIKALALTGIQQGDNVFTGRTSATNSYFSIGSGSIAAMSTRTNSTFKVSERFIQDFKPGDKRFEVNFRTGAYYNYVGGLTFSTRYQMKDFGVSYGGALTNGMADPSGNGYNTLVYSDKQTIGNLPLYIGSSYEETELILAEAEIWLGNIDAGLAHLDNVRTYQGSGLAATAGTGLTADQAKELVRSERRVALAWRGLSFYDARRWGFIYDVSKGGGRTGVNIQDATSKTNIKNCTINYNFLDFWDVPDNEVSTNKPSGSSVPTKNPN
ncbi:MAG: RagB/SusD family nutrient uptake outer membrane protein [Bacteroidetes bacterium]|nr:RagB/SusD family nutrient uptake outer membrane protein [Bacteroidota bacterium]